MSAAHAFRPEAPNTSEQSNKKNPTVGDLFDAYLRDRSSEHSYRPCKHPETLRVNLIEPRKLWADWRIDDFRVGSKSRVKEAVQGWREQGLALATCRKRCTIMRAAFRFAWKDELIERGQEPFFELPPSGAARERFVDADSELPTLLRELIATARLTTFA